MTTDMHSRVSDELPSITIVTPSYNQGHFIRRTITSVIFQDYQAVDYLVCDGASTDATRDILSDYQNHRLRIISEPDEGQADAIRKGFEMTSGEIVGWLNSDDILLPGTLTFVASYFRDNPDVDAIYSHRIFIDEADRISRFWILPPHSNYCMSRWDFIPQETCFWRRELMDRVGGIDTSFQFAMDYDLFARMMAQGRFKRVNRFLAAFREHEASKTTRLYDTQGEQEVERVRSETVAMRRGIGSFLIKHLFGQLVLRPSALYKFSAYLTMKSGLQKRVDAAVRSEEID